MYYEVLFVALSVFAAALWVGGWSLLFFFWRVFDDGGNNLHDIYRDAARGDSRSAAQQSSERGRTAA
ncbi:MAG TPA: hypothetical protein VK473_10915 [Terriglobales bacterium]|nr:hypothetical protein [Terriglobales bacterium]